MYRRFLPVTLLLSVLLALCAALGMRNNEVASTFSLAATNKEIYLTFDDGPSTIVTNRILDILKEEEVKATFFIVSDRARTRQETLRRIASEGHTLGVHSATHDYKTIYASEQAFFADVDECANYITKITGITPTCYRFPGGGFENRETLGNGLRKKGYRIISWNAVNGDEEIAGADAQTLVQETMKTSAGKEKVILLMHDSAPHKQTAEALPEIISYYRQQGYAFCAF